MGVHVPLYLIKLCITLAVILASAEVAKRSPALGAFIVVLPMVSILSMTWLYWDTRDVAKVSDFAREIFYLVPLSLLFFLPFLFEQRTHWPYWLNFSLGLLAMALAFALAGFWRDL
jgi:glycopeptide antibiotics resistance protein